MWCQVTWGLGCTGEAEGTEQQAGEQQARVAESSPAPGPSTGTRLPAC